MLRSRLYIGHAVSILLLRNINIILIGFSMIWVELHMRGVADDGALPSISPQSRQRGPGCRMQLDRGNVEWSLGDGRSPTCSARCLSERRAGNVGASGIVTRCERVRWRAEEARSVARPAEYVPLGQYLRDGVSVHACASTTTGDESVYPGVGQW